MKIGMIFPGYGSQFVGMCKELYDSSRLVQEYFEEASNCLNSNLIKLCFASSDAELSKIQNAYPAIFLVGSSIATLLKQEGIEPQVVAGYNTGEYAALFTAKGMSFPDGLYLLNKYAILYQEFLDELKDFEVVRVAGIVAQELELLCKDIRDSGAAVHIAVQVTPTEHIVAGLVSAVERVRVQLDGKGVKIKAASSEIGLHSQLMDPVIGRLSMYLEKVDFHDLAMPCISSIDGQAMSSKDSVKAHIINHINNPVCWPHVLTQLESCDCILEIGPGNSLYSIAQAWYPNKQILTINKPEDIEIVKSVCIKQEKNPVELIDEQI